MFASQKIVDVGPRLFFPSEPDETPRKEFEVDLTDENLGVGFVIPASNIDNAIILPGDRVEDAKGVDLSGSPADTVVGKLEMDGFLELGLELGCHDRDDRDGRCTGRVLLAFIYIRILARFLLHTFLRPQPPCGRGNRNSLPGARCSA